MKLLKSLVQKDINQLEDGVGLQGKHIQANLMCDRKASDLNQKRKKSGKTSKC